MTSMRWPVLALFLLLAACSRQGADEPFIDSRIPPALEQRFWPPQGWAWGLIQATADAAPARYGVAGPPGVRPNGDILILPGYGESAEAWFETVSALAAKGYVVWVLEGAGQGGSARFTRPRDLGHLPDGDVDRAALKAMLAVIGRPPLVLAQSTAAPVVILAAADGARLQGLLLSAPVLDAGEPPIRAGAAVGPARSVRRFRFGWLRAPGQSPWASPPVLLPGRAGVIDHWRQANPDLRMGGASWGWIAAFQDQTAALTPRRLKQVSTPVVMLTAPRSARAAATCRALPRCSLRTLPGARGSLHLEDDGVYRAWSEVVTSEAARVFPPESGA